MEKLSLSEIVNILLKKVEDLEKIVKIHQKKIEQFEKDIKNLSENHK